METWEKPEAAEIDGEAPKHVIINTEWGAFGDKVRRMIYEI